MDLETQAAQQAIDLTAEQIAQLEKKKPTFRDRYVKSSKLGALLSQDIFYVGRLKGVVKVYLHVALNAYGLYAFGCVR